MNDSDVHNTYRLALAKWGKKSHVIDYVLGSADLTKELSKNLKGDKNLDTIAKKIAQVCVSIEQLMHDYECDKAVLKDKHEILIRLKERVKE